jgi:hypothetical protein
VAPAVTTRDVLWGFGWACAIGCAQVSLRQIAGPSGLLQFGIQYGLTAMVVLVPGLLAWNLNSRRPSHFPLRWQIVVLLVLASFIAGAPWNSTTVGCPDC